MSNPASESLPLFGIYGAGGCGRGVLPVARDMLNSRFGDAGFELVFIDDAMSKPMINDQRVLTIEAFVHASATSKAVSIAVADSGARRELDKQCRAHGLTYFSVRAPNVVIMDDVEIGEAAILSPFVTLTSNVRVGRHFHANLYSYVEHDCVIGDFVTFAPSVQCNGNVHIGDHAYLGAGCVVRQGRAGKPLSIGRGAVVGMGAIVTEDVPPNVTVVGNPARLITGA